MNDLARGPAPAQPQPQLPPEERVRRALGGLAREFGALSGLRLESCIHCGMCADACHFYIGTEDPKYTPIWKVEPFKQAYKLESGPFAPLFKLFGLKQKVSADQLEEWQELLFDSCNLCGRCGLICPMGIDIPALIEATRHAMFEAGVAPKELHALAEHQQRTGRPWPLQDPCGDKLREIGAREGVKIPVDEQQADMLLLASAIEIDKYPQQVAALAKVMAGLSVRATFQSDGAFAENPAYFAGAQDWQRAESRRVIEAARACGAKVVIVPECGHAYTALRWEAAELNGGPLPFQVKYITEYLADEVRAGRLKLRKAEGGAVTFHDPCQLARKGGVLEAPRVLMHALGLDVRELYNNRGFSFCCAGGGGVMMIERAHDLRRRSLQPKLHEIDKTGAETVLVSCAGCRASFEDAAEHFHWKKRPVSLLELVASHLA